MATFLSRGDFDAVRKSIDLSLDEVTVPDEWIEMPQFRDSADRAILTIDPAAAAYSDPSIQFDRVRTAAILMTASFLAPAIPKLIRERTPDSAESQYALMDYAAIASALLARATTELQNNLENADPVGGAYLSGFVLGKGRRW